jgi:hypothetical protein
LGCGLSIEKYGIYNRGRAWLKQLLASVLRRLRFEPIPVHVEFVVNKEARDMFPPKHVRFPLPISLHQISTLIGIIIIIIIIIYLSWSWSTC